MNLIVINKYTWYIHFMEIEKLLRRKNEEGPSVVTQNKKNKIKRNTATMRTDEQEQLLKDIRAYVQAKE